MGDGVVEDTEDTEDTMTSNVVVSGDGMLGSNVVIEDTYDTMTSNVVIE